MSRKSRCVENIAADRSSPLCSHFQRDERGVTAVEFGMVATPFLMLLFGTIAVGLYFFVTFSLENAVETAGRMVRTGQAQMQVPPMKLSQFKTQVCNNAPSFLDCDNSLRVNILAAGNFNGLSAPSCLDSGGSLIPEPTNDSNVPGAAKQAVLVTVCYEWKLAGAIPFLKLGTMGNGSALIRAATVFETEPYN